MYCNFYLIFKKAIVLINICIRNLTCMLVVSGQFMTFKKAFQIYFQIGFFLFTPMVSYLDYETKVHTTFNSERWFWTSVSWIISFHFFLMNLQCLSKYFPLYILAQSLIKIFTLGTQVNTMRTWVWQLIMSFLKLSNLFPLVQRFWWCQHGWQCC